MSEAATFCVTCGAHVLPAPAPEPEAPPEVNAGVSDAADWDAADQRAADWDASDSDAADSEPFEAQSAPAPESTGVSAKPVTVSSAWSNPVVRIVIAVLAVILVNAILAAFVHSQVTSLVNAIPRVTMSDYGSIQVGQTLQQVEGNLGGPPTSQTPDPTSANGAVVDLWTNSNGSYVKVTFVNGVVSSLSESGLERVSEPSSASRLAGYILYPIQYIEGCMAAILCFYVATLLTGYRFTVKRIVVLGLIMSAVGLVLSIVLGPLGLLGIPIYLLVYILIGISLIMAWTGATGGDAVLIILGSWALRLVLWRVSGV